MAHIREGLGYTLKAYDPCFSFNNDNYTCSPAGAAFRKNILASDCPLTKGNSYNWPRNFDPTNLTVCNFGASELFQPDSFTFTPVESIQMWGSRLPFSVNVTGSVPCQKNAPYCKNPANCNTKSPCTSKEYAPSFWCGVG